MICYNKKDMKNISFNLHFHFSIYFRYFNEQQTNFYIINTINIINKKTIEIRGR
jgi:hypothetical protein